MESPVTIVVFNTVEGTVRLLGIEQNQICFPVAALRTILAYLFSIPLENRELNQLLLTGP